MYGFLGPSGPVFDLPAGCNANSVSAGIVNDVYLMPELRIITAAAVGLFTLSTRRRPRAAA